MASACPVLVLWCLAPALGAAGRRFAGIKAPRTPNWNKKAVDHHWFVDSSGVYGPMNDTVTDFSDLLYRRCGRRAAIQQVACVNSP